ncbi:DUF2127 domain-containing protein [bacterium]|nr:DUF2127 domain-containing protein [bacterium]
MPSPAQHQRTALHAVALLEAAKGVLIIAAGLGLLAFIHRDVEAQAEEIVRHFHLNPAHGIPRIFLEAASKADGGRLKLLALGAFGYASVRFAEAWGLWRGRPWAEWLGIASGSIYLPLEIYELFISVTPVKVGTFLVNVTVVAVLARERLTAPRAG